MKETRKTIENIDVKREIMKGKSIEIMELKTTIAYMEKITRRNQQQFE